MGINLATNSFIVANTSANRSELPTEIIRSKEISQKNKIANPPAINPEEARQNTKLKQNIYTLPPSENQNVNNYRYNQSSNRSSFNQPVSQYLETENIPKREELESLVRVDVFA